MRRRFALLAVKRLALGSLTALAIGIHCAPSSPGDPPTETIAQPVARRETWSWRRAPNAHSTDALYFDTKRQELVLLGARPGEPLEEWTWSGDDGFTLGERANAVMPAAAATTFDRARGVAIRFGGRDASGAHVAETWLSGGSGWQRVPTEHAPSPRVNAVMAFDSDRNVAVLYGGIGQAPGNLSTRPNDTWEWNGSDWSPVVTPPPPSPVPSTAAFIAFDAKRKRTVLLLRTTSPATFTTLERTNGAWTSVSTQATGSQLTYDTTREQVVASAGGVLWSWSGASWTPINANPGGGPAAIGMDEKRSELVGVSFGGTSPYYRFEGTDWVQRAPSFYPRVKDRYSMVRDEARENVVLFGGRIFGNTALNETWTWNGTQWRFMHPTTSPSARVLAAMGFDPVGQRVVLFGGATKLNFEGNDLLDDAWAWDGTNWSPLPGGPDPRVAASLSFDDDTQSMTLDGGIFAEYIPNDRYVPLETWKLSGSTWQPTVDSEFAFAATARDPVRKETFLFGGLDADAATKNLHARIDGRWTKLPNSTGPSQRFSAALGVDPISHDVLLYGGWTNVGTSAEPASGNDTWRWNGTRWQSLAILTLPPARGATNIAFDGKGFVLQTGQIEGNSETWLLTQLGGSCTTAEQCPGSLCTDGVCCEVVACGTCETCSGTRPGQCTAILNEEDPDTCAIADGKSCNRLGDCLGAIGKSATTVDECASGIIADGVCCNSPCDSACVSCRGDLKASGTLSGVCDTAKSTPEEACTPASCNADFTAVVNSDGTIQSCGAYKCEGGQCKTTCANVTDCAFPAACAADQRCVSSLIDSADSGCGLASSRGRTNSGLGLLLSLAALARRGVRRRRELAGARRVEFVNLNIAK